MGCCLSRSAAVKLWLTPSSLLTAPFKTQKYFWNIFEKQTSQIVKIKKVNFNINSAKIYGKIFLVLISEATSKQVYWKTLDSATFTRSVQRSDETIQLYIKRLFGKNH